MTGNSKMSGAANSIPMGLAIGWCVEIVCLAASCMVASVLILYGGLPKDNAGYCAAAILILISFIGAATACAKTRKKPLVISMVSGALLFITLACITALLCGGQYQTAGQTALLIAGSSGAAALLYVNGGKKERAVKRRYRR